MSIATYDPDAPAITMTPAALSHFQRAIAADGDKLVRLSTETSGCTGYSYVLNLVDQPEPEDLVIEPGEQVRMAVAPDALDLVRGTEIDMVTEGVNTVVKFNNPNVVAECGCGESFSV